MAYQVYVQNMNSESLMPTTRFGKVRRMLRAGLAKVVLDKPFTIRLLYKPETEIVQPLYGGIDGGRTNIGCAVLDKNGSAVYADHTETRNAEIHGLMEQRKQHRQASRRGARLRRKRRAKKRKTTTKKFDGCGRKLPRCEKPIPVKDIINKEAKFCNRTAKYKKPTGKLNPTTRQLVQTHINHVNQICKLLPVKDWTLELNKFAFMQLEDGTVTGVDFQNGRLKGYKDAKEYVSEHQNCHCAFCKKDIEEYHHIVPRCEGGFDGPENLIGLCKKHHRAVQNNEITSEKLIGKKKKFAGTSAWNQAMPYVYAELVMIFGEEHVHLCSGYETKQLRDMLKLPKSHTNDAICIAGIGADIIPKCNPITPYEVLQFRRHNRARINNQRERTYKMCVNTDRSPDEKPVYKVVAKNRHKRMDQKDDSLEEWYKKQVEVHGEAAAQKIRSQLKVEKSTRRYNNPNRLMPGAVVMYRNKRYVVEGTLAKEFYYRLYGLGKENILASKCSLKYTNRGLVYA